MTTFTVANAAQLSTALQSATGGDVIRLAGGDYGNFAISSKTFSSDITIMSADAGNPAVFNSLSVKYSSNINFDGLHIELIPTTLTVSSTPALMIEKSSGISFGDGVITGGNSIVGVPFTALTTDSTDNVIGTPTGRGVSIQASSDITIEGTEISVLHRGIVIGGSNGVTIRDNEIHHLRRSAIVGNSDNLLIEGNYLHSANPWRIGLSGGDHADFIALWTDSRQTTATQNITIRDNVLSQGDGARILGLWLQGGEDGYKNVVIEGNAILGGDHQGIMMSNTTGGRVTDNVLLQTTSYDKAPAILLLEGAAGITVDGNIAYSIADKNLSTTGNIITGNNTYAQKLDATKAGYYDSTLISQILTLQDADAIYNVATLDLADSTATNPSAPTDQATPAPTTSGLIVGTSGADTLFGSAGDDTFDSRGGADLLTGGLGDDTYIVTNTMAKIVEQLNGGTDTIVAKGNYVLGANVENLYISDTATNSWSAKGNGLSNIVVGNAGGNVLDGQGGADTLSGRDGNDVLIGGSGADRLTGGTGVDRFTFAKGSGKDVITDFGDGHDVLDISAFLKLGYKATVVDTGPDTVISFTTGDSITLVGVDKHELITTTGGFTI